MKLQIELIDLDEDDAEMHLRWFDAAEQLMGTAIYMTNSVQVVGNVFGPGAMLSLEMCARRLHKFLPEGELIEDRLPELVDLVRQAIDAISADTDIPVILRQQLVARLEEVLNALHRFRIAGYSGLVEVVDAFTGCVVRDERGRTEKTVNWLFRICTKVADLVKPTAQIVSSSENLMKAIEVVNQHPH